MLIAARPLSPSTHSLRLAFTEPTALDRPETSDEVLATAESTELSCSSSRAVSAREKPDAEEPTADAEGPIDDASSDGSQRGCRDAHELLDDASELVPDRGAPADM